ncbi:hypothetical protein [Enterobacter hormaechei]|uniref:hypothetical protein n=1 Tax=Enterobacter hormaechei TaxID=158836 RepID=UPI0032DBA353
MNALLHDAGEMTLIWTGLVLTLTGVFHLLMVFIPGEPRRQRLFRPDAVWCLKLLQGDMAALWAFILVLLMVVTGIAFSEMLIRWALLWPGVMLQCLVLLYAGGCLFNTARRMSGGFSGLRPLTALIISLFSVRMGWLLAYGGLP